MADYGKFAPAQIDFSQIDPLGAYERGASFSRQNALRNLMASPQAQEMLRTQNFGGLAALLGEIDPGLAFKAAGLGATFETSRANQQAAASRFTAGQEGADARTQALIEAANARAAQSSKPVYQREYEAEYGPGSAALPPAVAPTEQPPAPAPAPGQAMRLGPGVPQEYSNSGVPGATIMTTDPRGPLYPSQAASGPQMAQAAPPQGVPPIAQEVAPPQGAPPAAAPAGPSRANWRPTLSQYHRIQTGKELSPDQAQGKIDLSFQQIDLMRNRAAALLQNPLLDLAVGRYGNPTNKAVAPYSYPEVADTQNDIDSLSSDVKNAVLSQQKEASTTGSAGFGRILLSEWENFGNIVAPIHLTNSPPKMRQSLKQIIEFADASKKRQVDRFKAVYGFEPETGSIAPPPASTNRTSTGIEWSIEP